MNVTTPDDPPSQRDISVKPTQPEKRGRTGAPSSAVKAQRLFPLHNVNGIHIARLARTRAKFERSVLGKTEWPPGHHIYGLVGLRSQLTHS